MNVQLDDAVLQFDDDDDWEEEVEIPLVAFRFPLPIVSKLCPAFYAEIISVTPERQFVFRVREEEESAGWQDDFTSEEGILRRVSAQRRFTRNRGDNVYKYISIALPTYSGENNRTLSWEGCSWESFKQHLVGMVQSEIILQTGYDCHALNEQLQHTIMENMDTDEEEEGGEDDDLMVLDEDDDMHGGGPMCSICCNTLTSVSTLFSSTACFPQLDAAASDIASSTAINPPCGDPSHAMCADCARRFITDYHNHTIGVGAPVALCPHDGCFSEYDTEKFRGLLTETQMEQLTGYASRFQSGAVTVACPVCAQQQSLDPATLQDAQEGSVIVRPMCGHPAFCFHCLDSGGLRHGGGCCWDCFDGIKNKLGSINHYFRRPGKTKFDGKSPLMRNCEITAPMCTSQLLEIAAGDVLHATCAGCATPLHKAEACNTLTHCGLAHCYHCGYVSSEWSTLMVDHYDSHGSNGRCPRFDRDDYWRVYGAVSLCDSTCQNQHGDCCIPEHTVVRHTQICVRKTKHIHEAFLSLHPTMRYAVVTDLMLRFSEQSAVVPGLDFVLATMTSIGVIQ